MKMALTFLSVLITLMYVFCSCDVSETKENITYTESISETETERVYFEIDENGDIIPNIRYIETHINYPGFDRHAIRNILMEVCETFVYSTAEIRCYDYYEHTRIFYTEIYNGFLTNSSYCLEIRDGYIVEISDGHIPIINPSPTPVVTPQIYEEAYKMLEEIIAGYGWGEDEYGRKYGYNLCSEEFEIQARYDIANDKYYLFATAPYTGRWDTYPDHVHGLADIRYYLN